MYCLDCKLEKNIEDFGRNKRRKTGRQSYCLPCMKARTRASYHKHKKAYFERALKRNKETNILINTVKDVPCKDCGVRYPPYVMDFDHMGKSKKASQDIYYAQKANGVR